MVVTKIINKIIGDPNDKELIRLKPIVEHVNKIEAEYQNTLKKEDIPKKPPNSNNVLKTMKVWMIFYQRLLP